MACVFFRLAYRLVHELRYSTGEVFGWLGFLVVGAETIKKKQSPYSDITANIKVKEGKGIGYGKLFVD